MDALKEVVLHMVPQICFNILCLQFLVHRYGTIFKALKNMNRDINIWNKVWVKPQGCVVKVFLRGFPRILRLFPRVEYEGSQKIFRRQT